MKLNLYQGILLLVLLSLFSCKQKEDYDIIIHEIRTISYLLHPPLLDGIGLDMAVRIYLEGFSKRTGIKVELDLPEDTERMPVAVELVLFRVIQEALTNVWRHSGSAGAMITDRKL